jgi:hypothetical protein
METNQKQSPFSTLSTDKPSWPKAVTNHENLNPAILLGL